MILHSDYPPSRTRQPRCGRRESTQPSLPHNSPAINSSRRHSIAAHVDQPLRPFARSSEYTADGAVTEIDKAKSIDDQHLYTGDNPPWSPRSAAYQEIHRPITEPIPPPPHHQMPPEMVADRSQSRTPRALQPADCYRPTYERRLADDSTDRPVKAPKSPVNTPSGPGGRKSACSEPNAPAEQIVSPKLNMSSELNAFVGRNATSSKGNDQLSEHNAQPNTPVHIQKRPFALDSTPLPNNDILPQLNAFAESIKISSNSTMREERTRREAEWRARVHHRHLRHRDTFPILVEETEFRAARADQLHQTNEVEASRAQARQDSAASGFASALQEIRSSLNDGLQSCDTEETISLRVAAQAREKSTWQTSNAEIAVLRTDFQNAKDALKGDVDQLRATAQERVKSIRNTSNTEIATLNTDFRNAKEAREKDRRDIDHMKIQLQDLKRASVEAIETQKKSQEEHVKCIQNKFDDLGNDLLDSTMKSRTLGMAQISHEYASQADFTKLERNFEDGIEKAVQTIREDQNAATEVFMRCARKIEADLTEHKASKTAHTQIIADLSKHFSTSQEQQSADTLSRQPAGIQTPFSAISSDGQTQNFDLNSKSLRERIAIVEARNARHERDMQAIHQFVMNQQQKFDGLTTTRLTQNLVNAMIQMYPPHPEHVIARVNQLSELYNAIEQETPQKFAAYEGTFRAQIDSVARKVDDILNDLASLSKAQQDSTVLYRQIAAEVTNYKIQTQGSFKRSMDETSTLRSKVERLENHRPVASPTPPSMESRLPSISGATQGANEVRARASSSASETPLYARNRPSARVSSTEAPKSGKRLRHYSDSSDEKMPLSAGASKRYKGIRRMNTSLGGIS